MIAPDLYPTIIRLAPFGALNGLARSCRGLALAVRLTSAQLVEKFTECHQSDTNTCRTVKKCLPNGWTISVKVTRSDVWETNIVVVKYVNGRPNTYTDILKLSNLGFDDARRVMSRGLRTTNMRICRYGSTYAITTSMDNTFRVRTCPATSHIVKFASEDTSATEFYRRYHNGVITKECAIHAADSPAPSTLEGALEWYEQNIADNVGFVNPLSNNNTFVLLDPLPDVAKKAMADLIGIQL